MRSIRSGIQALLRGTQFADRAGAAPPSTGVDAPECRPDSTRGVLSSGRPRRRIGGVLSNSIELAYLPISWLSRLIATKEISPVEVTRAALHRIAILDGFSSTFIEVLNSSAAAQAQVAESEINRGVYRGALHGIPVALKDLCDVEGTVTTAGSKVLGERPADSDCDLARRLRAAGAIIIGKTNLHEFAYGGTGVNPHFGTPPNPWGLDRIPGGSSSGSAVAVATGMAPAAIGSDTGGSIRLPAAHCGITGLKPTFGRVSRRGVFPLSMTLDNVGPMTRSALDCALVLEAIAGYDSGDPYSVDRRVERFSAGIDNGIRGRRIGVPSNFFFEDLEAGVGESVRQALDVLRDLGGVLVDVEIPWAIDAFENNIVGIEAAWVHRDRLADPEISARLGKDTLKRLRQGSGIDAIELHGRLNRRAEIASMAASMMANLDLIATPTSPGVAGRTEEVETLTYRPNLKFTGVFNQTWQPSLSIPCGFGAEGLPVGLMLTGAMWNERFVLRAGHAFQQVTDWHTAQAPVG